MQSAVLARSSGLRGLSSNAKPIAGHRLAPQRLIRSAVRAQQGQNEDEPSSRRNLLAGLFAGAGALSAVAAPARADDAAGVASSRMSYSRFLEYLEMGRVKK
ncbi:hypothetical protein CHLNCDRAFT_138512, partial [Chlorella variabilis]